jgi:hypothetical protein
MRAPRRDYLAPAADNHSVLPQPTALGRDHWCKERKSIVSNLLSSTHAYRMIA